LGKPIMTTHADSPSADAFRTSAKNVAAQCSIIASNLQEEMASESSNTEPSDDATASEATTS